LEARVRVKIRISIICRIRARIRVGIICWVRIMSPH